MTIKPITRFVFLFALLALQILPASAAERQKVLFTTFDPFGGSKENNSQAIGAQLKAHPEWIDGNTEVAICNLPVVYDVAPKLALACIEKERPALVVSLGEANCQLRVESAANNSDNTPGFPDNAGNIRNGGEIIPGAPARLGFAFPVEAMICAVDPRAKAGIVASIDPGNFVCNNLAYTLTFDLAQKKIPFTFIHVPNSQCAAQAQNPQANARIIARAVAAADRALRSPHRTEALWRPVSRAERMPALKDEVAALLTGLKASKAPACQLSYAKRLEAAY